MATVRQNILSNIKTTLETIATLKTVDVDRPTVPDLETEPFPCAFIYSGSEIRDREEGVIGRETWNWEVLIEVWALGNDMETILKEIHDAMHSDYTRGDFAFNSFRTGVQFFYIEPEKNLKSMLISYEVRYDHTLGSM